MGAGLHEARPGPAARRVRRLTIYLPIILMGAAGPGHLLAGAQHAGAARRRDGRGSPRRTSPTTSCAASRSRRFDAERRAARARSSAPRRATFPTPTRPRSTSRASARFNARRADRRVATADRGTQQRRRHRGAADRRCGRDARGRDAARRPARPRLEFRGEFLHAFLDTERVKSHKPVTLTRGDDRFTADSLDFDNLDRVLDLQAGCAACWCRGRGAKATEHRMRPAGLHHRRIQRHRPGAGLALSPGRLAAGAGGAPHRGDRSLGRRRRASRAERWRVYGADVADTSTASWPPARPAWRSQGVPDVVIANAGISVGVDTAEREDLDVIARTFAINNIGLAATFHPFIAGMVARGSGAPGGHRQRRRHPRAARSWRLLRQQGRRDRLLRKPARRTAPQRREGGDRSAPAMSTRR